MFPDKLNPCVHLFPHIERYFITFITVHYDIYQLLVRFLELLQKNCEILQKFGVNLNKHTD